MTPPLTTHARGRAESRARIAQRAMLRRAVEAATSLLTAGEIRELVDRSLDEIEGER